MLQLATHYRRVSRWVAIVLLVAGWVGPLALPHLSNDDLCEISDSSRPAQLNAWDGKSAPAHCIICHAARTFGTSVAEGRPLLTGLVPGTVLLVPRATFHDATRFARLPARAPPAA